MGQLQKIEPQLLELGYQIIALSPDTPDKLPPTRERNSLNYTLLSDSQAKAAQAFGIAFKAGGAHPILPVPAVFLVGEKGKILFVYANPDYRIRLHPDILLAAGKAYAGE